MSENDLVATDTNVATTDTISRQAALDAFDEIRHVLDKKEKELTVLPSAQPSVYKEEMVGDAISRQGVLRLLNAVPSEEFATKAMLISGVNALPSAQPERKKGKWIERNPQNSPDCRLIECSECGNAYIVGYNINYDDWIDGRNFCMKCGADLRGSNDKNT